MLSSLLASSSNLRIFIILSIFIYFIFRIIKGDPGLPRNGRVLRKVSTQKRKNRTNRKPAI